jgi:hypothetical protein
MNTYNEVRATAQRGIVAENQVTDIRVSYKLSTATQRTKCLAAPLPEHRT